MASATSVDRVIETHGGGGQYDCITLFLGEQPAGEGGPLRVEVNRQGRVHVFGPGPDDWQVADLLTALDHGLPMADAVAWVMRAAQVQQRPRTGANTQSSLGMLAEVIASASGGGDGRRWEWRNGQLDASDGGGKREELFAALPSAADACVVARGDLLGLPGYRFWFLLADGRPVLAVELSSARVYAGADSWSVIDADNGECWRRLVTDATAEPGLPIALGATPAQVSVAARLAFRPVATRLAAQIAPALQPYRPGAGLTARAEWFIDPAGGLLVIAVGAHEDRDVTDEVLAYALAWQHDRDLAVVVPRSHVGLTLERLPWIATPVRVFVYEEDRAPRPAVVPSRVEVLAAARERPRRNTAIHDLGAERAAWVAALVQAADDHWALVAQPRAGYLAWHCAGRQVLRVSRARAGLVIEAGVSYSKPIEGQLAPLKLPVHAPLTPAERAEVEARVATAIWERLAGHDRGHTEHRMQAALASTRLEGLGLTRLFAREYPAWRGDTRPGFIDFLGLDRGNQIHVVETKVGTDDVKVVLQSLDYATWVSARGADIRAERGWPDAAQHERVVIDLVVAPKGGGKAIGPYLAGQLEALSGDVAWRIATVADPLADVPDISVPLRRCLLAPASQVAKLVQPARWATRVGNALLHWGTDVEHPAALLTPDQALLPQAAPVFAHLAERGLVHRWAMSPRSSQTFALNLFAPLDAAGLLATMALLGLDAVNIEPADFEYSDPADRLGEHRPGSPHGTQIDVLLVGESATGERLGALVEVKFTETDFSGCSAYDNPANPHRDVCRSAGLFGGRPEDCFQLANHGAGRRRYDKYLADIPVVQPSGSSDAGGCLVRKSLNQPMRNLALAHLLLETGELDRVTYAVCAPRSHPTIWRRFLELQEAFPDTMQRTIRPLTAEQVGALHLDHGAALAARYPADDLTWVTTG